MDITVTLTLDDLWALAHSIAFPNDDPAPSVTLYARPSPSSEHGWSVTSSNEDDDTPAIEINGAPWSSERLCELSYLLGFTPLAAKSALKLAPHIFNQDETSQLNDIQNGCDVSPLLW